ncbi:MAG: hypothetical protein JSW11_07830 [Candidatus Heimdallarchaeota archaeon]|nr:MAG: hypothetical protein JSW11_07830 [Candidatus Heimdallarchaeota archaeon]
MQVDEVIYRRWVIIIPILMIIIGIILFHYVGSVNKAIGLVGGLITLIGVLTLGALFSMMLGIELGSRALEKQVQDNPSFRERIEASKQSSEEDRNTEK